MQIERAKDDPVLQRVMSDQDGKTRACHVYGSELDSSKYIHAY